MELRGEHRIPAARQVVWDALQDPAILRECINGCSRLDRLNDRQMKATVTVRVGPVKATFDADIEIVDPVAPERYTLRGEGRGGVAGFAKGEATVTLADDGPDTLLSYVSSAQVGGKLAQLGSRLVDSTARRYAADFFTAFSEKVGAGPLLGVPPRPAAAVARDIPAAAESVPGRIEPSVAEEGLFELEAGGAGSPVASPHAEDALETRLETASADRVWGGSFLWGVLAFAAVILVLLALQ